MNNWDYIFIYSSVFSPLIPIGIYLTQKHNDRFKVIMLFVFVSFASDLLSIYVVKGSNYLFLHAYGLVEAMLLFLFFYKVLENRRWIPFLAVCYGIYYTINSLLFEMGMFNTIGRSIECLLIIFLCLRLFYQFFHNEEDLFLEKSPLFWITVGLLTYFSGAFLTFVFSRYILVDEPLWILHNISNVLKNTFIAIGLWKMTLK
ncbi:hypothetical protein [Roseivirga thermotolerans]|uniref:Lysoplasmalogenase n=1 Tax=Roseivirga thermotolerans TaxID=1758176 RepID=A0ABQ3I9U9_9BACT|nr:hypothetical protein [Roseivirga thermotolerans]GHE74507.1 hypothetical protein GCM10011340_33860 [Roseivirga thermotolerans]